MPSPRRSLRALVLLLATVLAVPLTALMGVAPAHAAPGAASGLVSDSLGDPLDGVTVTALSAPAFTASAGQTATAGGGAYSLPLAEGSYRLQFAKAGYTTALYGGSDEPLQVDVDDEGQLSVDGEPLEGNELEEVQLSSTQTYSVTGVVQNAGSTPLSGINVAAYYAGDEEDAVATATTNGSGAYSLTLSPGVYHVRYTDPGSTYVPAWFDGTGSEPVDVVVTANRSLTTVKLATPPADAEFPIAGTVLDANGDPVSGVDVSVTPIGGSTDSGTGTTAPEGDDAGRYSVSVKPGTYRVGFARTGWVSTLYGGQTTPATVTVGPTGALSASAGDPLVANRLNDVTLVSNPFAVTGLVQVSGGTTPIADITVRAFPTGSTDAGDVVDTDTTDSSGSYTLNLPVGTYDLEYVDNVPQPTTYSSASLVDVQVGQGGALKVGGVAVETLDPVKLSLSSADTTHPVLGSVIDANGAEIDGLSVSAVPQGSGSGDVDESGDDGAAGAHGRYRLQLKPGSYEIHVAGGTAWENATYQGGGEVTAIVAVAVNGTISVNGTPIAGRDLGETEVVGKTKYALSGTVTDGTAGLPGITVKAYREGDLATAVASTTSTGSTGAWSLSGVDGLVVGTYVVEFSGTSGGNTYDKAWYGGATATPVEIAQGGGAKVAGVPVVDNKLGAVTLTRSSADTPHPVTGEVTDANDDPIDGVTVTATPQGGSGTLASTTTAANVDGDHGRYRLLLKPGTYRVSYALSGFTGTTYPGGDLSPVDVKVNLDGTVLIGTTPSPEAEMAPVELVDATADGVVSGRVVSGGNGIGGITVEVFPYGDVSGTPVATATTATSGTVGAWSVNTLKIGTYTVRYTDNVPAAPSYIQTYVGGSELATSAPVKVGQGNVVTVATVPTTPNGAVGDTTIAAESADTTYPVVGELLDEAGDPIDGATVTAVPQSPTPGTNQATDLTGPDGELGDHGRYRLLLKPGTYRLDFTATGFSPASYPGAGETAVNVTVASGGVITPATLDSATLADAAGDDTISGQVVAGGNGVAGIVAEVFPAGDLSAESRVAVATATNASGNWTVPGLKIGEYTIRFTDNGLAAPAYVQTYYGGATLAESTPVKVGQGHVISVNDVPKAGGALGSTTVTVATVDTTYPLTGDVTDANGEPLAGVTVSVEVVSGGGVADPVVTDDEGAYTLRVRAGTYRVKFTRTGFATAYLRDAEGATASVVVATGGAVSIGGEPVPGGALETVELRSAARSLTGRVLGAATGGDTPLGGITVRATTENTELAPITTTSASNGTFTLALPVGTYQIEFVGRAIGGTTWDGTFYGGRTTPDQIKVSTAGPITVVDSGQDVTSGLDDVVLEKSTGIYEVRGTVSDETGEPLAGATVRAFKAGTGTQAGFGTSDAEGAFTISVPVGRYNLRYEKAGKATTWLLNADAETTTYAVVTVAPGGAISAPGVMVTGGVLEDVQLLLPAPRLVAAPKVSGKVLVGKTITTSLGTWSPDYRSTPDWQDYVTIEWFIDGQPADDYSDGDLFEKFVIPGIAGGRTISYRITIEDPNPDGATRAPAVFTSKGIKVPKAKPKLVATYKGGKLTVVVKVPGLKRPLGSIVVKDGKKKLAAGTLKAKNKGKLVLKLKKPKKGKRKLTITYGGDANVAPAKVTVKLKI